MTDKSDYPRLVLHEGFGERDAFEIELKGWFTAHIELENGDRYALNFYDPTRLTQELEDYVQMGRPYFYELNLVVVPRVTIGAIKECVALLWRKRAFDDLRPEADRGR